jgi:hypothetical protein
MWQPGQAVEWKYTQPRGWNLHWWVPATVVSVGRSRVTIDAALVRGGVKRVRVKAENLRAK